MMRGWYGPVTVSPIDESVHTQPYQLSQHINAFEDLAFERRRVDLVQLKPAAKPGTGFRQLPLKRGKR